MNLIGLLTLAIPPPPKPGTFDKAVADTLTALDYGVTTCVYCGASLSSEDKLGACPGCLQGDD